MRKLVLVFLLCFFTISAHAQVLITGETGGKNGKALLISANALMPEGLNLFNAYVQFGYGLTSRFDGFVSYGNISALGQTQHYFGVGGNLNLFKRNQEKGWADISWFNVVSIPLHRRKEASTILLNTAVVVSRPVGKITVYSGLNFLIPLGAVRDKLFTPPEIFINVPVGASFTLSKRWIFYGEYDAGTNLKTAGIGFLRIF